MSTNNHAANFLTQTGDYRHFRVALLLIVMLAAVIRLYRLGDFPQRFDADEMGAGYEAWSLWSTGADQHGTVLPLHLRGYNEYGEALPAYMMAPFVGLLGLNEFSARLPLALMGIATVFLTGILGRRWFGAGAGLFAALFLAIDPWHVNFTRVAYYVGAAPLFTVLAFYVFTRFIDSLNADRPRPRDQLINAVLSALCFALLTLSYAPMKLQAPLLMAGCILAAWAPLRQHRRIAVIWLEFYVLFISPLIYDQIVHWQLIQHHFGQISITEQTNWFLQLLNNYASQYNPGALFFTGLNRTLGYPMVFGIGELFWLEGPLWIIAAIGLLRRVWRPVKLDLSILLAVWFFTFPIASALTWGPTSHREINFLPLPELLAGYGVVLILNRVSRLQAFKRVALYAIGLTGLIALLSFCILFFGSFFATPFLATDTPSEKIPYNVGLRSILDYINRNVQPCDEIWLEPTYQTYMAYLFYTRYPPARFQKAQFRELTSVDGWLYIPGLDLPGLGHVHFGETAAGIPPPDPACVDKSLRTWIASKSGFVVGAEWRLLLSINNKSGNAIWRLQARDTSTF